LLNASQIFGPFWKIHKIHDPIELSQMLQEIQNLEKNIIRRNINKF